jgi:DNA-binding NarL/FixJ family response regulator
MLDAYRPREAVTTSKIRIIIADDHQLVRASLHALLSSQLDMEVVAVAPNGREAVKLAKAHQPDVIVMDVVMPELDGISATEKILALNLRPRPQIVVLSFHNEVAIAERALKKGAAGFVSKQRASDDLPRAIRLVQNGKRFLGVNHSTKQPTKPDIATAAKSAPE